MGKHCEARVISKGLKEITSWRSCYYHPRLKTFLIVYVDDFNLLGPSDKLQGARGLMLVPSKTAPKGIAMDPPTAVGRYFGCEHHIRKVGRLARRGPGCVGPASA